MGLFDGAFDNADGQRAVLAQALQDVWDGGKETARSVGGALTDEQFYRDVGGGLRDVAYRGVAGAVGTPVDLASIPFSLVGLGHPAPVGGSEWIGQRMEDAGLISSERRPVAEFLSAFATPAAGAKAARGVSHAVDHAIANYSPGPLAGSRQAQKGVLYLPAKNRIIADLKAEKGSGTYLIGDASPWQGQGLDDLFGAVPSARNVYMDNRGIEHLLEGRVWKDRFTPDEVGLFLEQALAKKARPDLYTAAEYQFPSLLNKEMRDRLTGRMYSARAPLRQIDDGYVIRTVYPEGLWGRKAPK